MIGCVGSNNPDVHSAVRDFRPNKYRKRGTEQASTLEQSQPENLLAENTKQI